MVDEIDDGGEALVRAAMLRALGSPRKVERALDGGVERGRFEVGGIEEQLAERGLTVWIPPWGGPAPVLLVRGTPPSKLGVGVVGARASDPYGLAVAKRVAEDAVTLGRPVVSGGAQGCDGAAHQAALASRGQTVVVAGWGHDHVYPRVNSALFDRIVEAGGAVVSPFWPSTPPARHRFLFRNKVIAALSAVVVVARASSRSGSLSTAKAARDQGRPVMVVPGAVGEGLSTGGNGLLAAAEASALIGPRSLARALGARRTAGLVSWPERHLGHPSPWPREDRPAGAPIPALDVSDDAQTVLALLEEAGPLDLDGLLVRTGLPTGVLMAALSELEVAGLLDALPGQRYRALPRGGL